MIGILKVIEESIWMFFFDWASRFKEGIHAYLNNNKSYTLLKKFLMYYSHVYCNVVSTNPIIIVTVYNLGKYCRFFPELLQRHRAYFIIICWDAIESEKTVKQLKSEHNEYKKKFPEHELIYLCNSARQHTLFKKFQLPCIFCNQNAFLDENIFKIVPDAKKKYDAIYNARLAPFKRHYLASKINNLAFITYFIQRDLEYLPEIKNTFANATWLNYPVTTKIPEEKIYRYLNEAKVGLCLSASEGAMYASVEYLLCGLPIVSTNSEGGRDIFFDKEYVKIVNDTPEAVTEGVRELMNNRISPEYIREKTLEKMKLHRERFISLIQSIYNKEGVKKDFQKEYDKIFTNKMLKYKYAREFQKEILREIKNAKQNQYALKVNDK